MLRLFCLVVRMFPAVMILVPVFIWMMKGFFDGVPHELEEAARIDGASRLTAMVRGLTSGR